LNRVYNDDIPSSAKIAIFFGAIMISFFNLLLIPIVFQRVYDSTMSIGPHKHCKCHCHLPTSACHIAATISHYTVKKVEVDLFLATRLVVKAKQAKERVAGKKKYYKA
jgi:hypothetical protein